MTCCCIAPETRETPLTKLDLTEIVFDSENVDQCFFAGGSGIDFEIIPNGESGQDMLLEIQELGKGLKVLFSLTFPSLPRVN